MGFRYEGEGRKDKGAALMGDGLYCEHTEVIHHILVTKDNRIIVKRRIAPAPRRVPARKKFLVIGDLVLNR